MAANREQPSADGTCFAVRASSPGESVQPPSFSTLREGTQCVCKSHKLSLSGLHSPWAGRTEGWMNSSPFLLSLTRDGRSDARTDRPRPQYSPPSPPALPRPFTRKLERQIQKFNTAARPPVRPSSFTFSEHARESSAGVRWILSVSC